MQKIFQIADMKFKIYVIIEGFADRKCKLANQQVEIKISAACKKRATMQGFADRSGANKEDKVFLGSLKNYSR